MSFEVDGRRVLITGASSGIGAGLAERLAEQGAVVGICARREDRLAAVLERCQAHSPGSRMWVVDLNDLDAVDALAASALEELGGVDVLINNAAIPKRKHVTALNPGVVESVMHINFFSPVRLTFALLPHMLERGVGHIINISSVAATLSSPAEAAYSASKAALSVFSESIAVDLWDTGINVLTVYPGVVDTELFSIPDNDPLTDAVEKITVEELVEGVMDALALGQVEVYIPKWFKDIATQKASNVGAFLAGTADWVRQQG